MKTRVCLIQDNPVFFDKKKTLFKVEGLIKKYGKDCHLIVFPESFIPGYPRGFSFGTRIGSRSDEGRKLYSEYYNNSVDIGSEEKWRLEKLAKKYNVYIVIGVTEKNNITGSLYCSMLYFSPSAGLLGVHRKIKPTGSERVVWGEAAGDSLVTFDTRIGKLGGLICWENYMPLARMSVFSKGVEIYIAPTADSRDEWTSTMRHIALEGRCFVLGCNQYFTKSMYPSKYRQFVKDDPEIICRGGSIIVSPSGKVLAGPLFDRSGVLYAELDLQEVVLNKLDFDVAGHYSRNDIFDLTVKGQPDIIKET